MSEIDLDSELVQQILVPENLLELKKSGIGPHMVKDTKVLPLLQFVFNYLDKYGKPPSESAIAYEWEGLSRTGPTVDP